jgi:hypothetical protein
MNRKLSIAVLLLLTSILCALSLSGCGVKRTDASQARRSFPAINLPEPGKVEPFQGCGAPYVLGTINAYNARDFGSPGWRRVSLDLITNGQISRSFTVVNLWKDEQGEVKTLFLLQEPKGLCGTNYLLDEDKAATSVPDMKVYLFLPSGQRQVLEIEPSKFNEGLLGSDFTYTDMRMQLPAKGYNYRLAGQCELHNEPTWVIEAEPASEEIRQTSNWAHARFYLARNFQFLLGADYYTDSEEGNGGSKPSKKMRVVSFEQINNVWTATQINMITDENHYSILKMKDARFKLPKMDSRLFQVNELSALADNIRQGWTPEELDRRAR